MEEVQHRPSEIGEKNSSAAFVNRRKLIPNYILFRQTSCLPRYKNKAVPRCRHNVVCRKDIIKGVRAKEYL